MCRYQCQKGSDLQSEKQIDTFIVCKAPRRNNVTCSLENVDSALETAS
jgi:hypothetical protein